MDPLSRLRSRLIRNGVPLGRRGRVKVLNVALFAIEELNDRKGLLQHLVKLLIHFYFICILILLVWALFRLSCLIEWEVLILEALRVGKVSIVDLILQSIHRVLLLRLGDYRWAEGSSS